MKNRVISLAILALIVVSFSFTGSFVYNYMFDDKKETVEETEIMGLKNPLALSEAQMCKMKGCQWCFKDNCVAINSQFKTKKINLIKELSADNMSTDNINAIIREIDSLQSLLLHTTVNNILEQKNILDNSQKDKFFSILLTQVSNEQKNNKRSN